MHMQAGHSGIICTIWDSYSDWYIMGKGPFLYKFFLHDRTLKSTLSEEERYAEALR